MKGYQVIVEEFCSDHNNIIVSSVIHTDLSKATREFKNTIIDLAPDEDMLKESTERSVSFFDDEGYSLNIYIHEVEVRCPAHELRNEIQEYLNSFGDDEQLSTEDMTDLFFRANQLLVKVAEEAA